MKSRLILAVAGVCAIALATALAIAPSASRTQRASAAVYGLSQHGMSKSEKRHLSGFASLEAGIGVPAKAPAAKASARMKSAAVTLCPRNFGSNVMVNQNCLNVTDPDLQGRGQAQNETAIAQNPNNPRQMVAGFNDYRRGDGTCGAAFSSNGGSSWTDTTMPNGFTRGTNFGGVARQYWQAGGDPSVAWDSRGNAYYACQVFMRGPGTTNNPDLSSAVYVFRSTGDGGASWNFTGHPAVETFNSNPAVLTDKPYMTIDNNPNSPYRDRIYVTWTQFAADGSAYIMEVHSDDYGQTFSSPVVASTTSSTLCTNPGGGATPNGTCNNNQFSDPFTAPNGDLYVTYANFNNTVTGNDNRNQVLLTESTDGGQTFGAPVKVSDYYELPDCLAAQGSDAFRACVPEKGTQKDSIFRAANYPSGAVNPTNPNQVVVTVASYINRDSNENNGCTPDGLSSTTGGNLYIGTKTAGACNNKIMLSVSNNAGASFTGSTTDPRQLPVVNTTAGQKRTDQWFQWAAFTPKGTLVTSYYDRSYGSDETTGNMDFSVSTSTNLSTFKVTRATSASMPLPTQFPDGNGNGEFIGDYTGVSALSGANPLWSDTRNPDAFLCTGTGVAGVPPAVCTGTEPDGLLANDQQIYTRRTPAS